MGAPKRRRKAAMARRKERRLGLLVMILLAKAEVEHAKWMARQRAQMEFILVRHRSMFEQCQEQSGIPLRFPVHSARKDMLWGTMLSPSIIDWRLGNFVATLEER